MKRANTLALLPPFLILAFLSISCATTSLEMKSEAPIRGTQVQEAVLVTDSQPEEVIPPEPPAEIQPTLIEYLLDNYRISEGQVRILIETLAREMPKYQVRVEQVLSIIIVESNFQPRAVSSAGARGLMQITRGTGKHIAKVLGEPWKGPKSMHDVERNVRYGVWYYAYLLDTFQDERLALVAYNAGPGFVQNKLRRDRRIPVVYPNKVLEAEEQLREEMPNGIYLYDQRQQSDSQSDAEVRVATAESSAR